MQRCDIMRDVRVTIPAKRLNKLLLNKSPIEVLIYTRESLASKLWRRRMQVMNIHNETTLFSIMIQAVVCRVL